MSTTRTVHLASKIAQTGDVSAACFERPAPIDMTRETWTLDPTAVTCEACKNSGETDEQK